MGGGEIGGYRWLAVVLATGMLLAASCAEQAVEAGQRAAARETEQARRIAEREALLAQHAPEEPAAEEAPAGAAPAGPAEGAPAGSEVIEIVASEFAFHPASIQLVAGQKVTLTIVNEGAIPHDFQIQALEAEDIQGGRSGDQVYTPTIDPGQRLSITFVPQASGSYTFVCTVPGHEEAGMTGEAVVSP